MRAEVAVAGTLSFLIGLGTGAFMSCRVNPPYWIQVVWALIYQLVS